MGNWHRLWCLLFGPFYYLFKGMFLWAILSFFTLNGLWIGFPLFNRAIVLRHYHRKGWVQEWPLKAHVARIVIADFLAGWLQCQRNKIGDHRPSG